MKLTQDQKVKLIGKGIQITAGVGLLSLIGYLFYNLATANSRGLERAHHYQKQKGKKKPKSMLPQELQPEYIEKQRRKYKARLQQQNTAERAETAQRQ